MKRLTKYFIIVYSVLAILLISIYILGIIHQNQVKDYASKLQITEQGKLITPLGLEPYQQPVFLFNQILGYLLLFGFPIFIIFMSALCLYKEKEGYLKSLFIPISYVLLGLIISFSWLFLFVEGEEGMLIIYLIPQFAITLILSLIINWVVLAVVKK